MAYKKVLIPTDGSPLSNAAARAGVDMAKQLGAEVVGVYVSPEFRFLIYGDQFPMNAITEDEYKALEKKASDNYLSEIQADAQAAGVKFTPYMAHGNSASGEIIAAAAKHDCDMIFIGSHGRGGLGQVLLGSVTSKILSTCDKPVLVYRVKH
ncbi:universal stress protein [Herbaspirillum sp. HC18]|nr:universal stress protein [Herbaspirillum sp. HC18]